MIGVGTYLDSAASGEVKTRIGTSRSGGDTTAKGLRQPVSLHRVHPASNSCQGHRSREDGSAGKVQPRACLDDDGGVSHRGVDDMSV